jgi:hypothetical protein
MSGALTSDALVGGWRLTSFEITFSDDAPVVHPFGERARGQLLYTSDGQMSAILCPAERAPLGVGGLESTQRADATQKAAAFDSYMSYAGRWSLEGSTVTHHVDFALVPDVVGHDHVRQASFDDDGALVLAYERPTRRGATAHYALRWIRTDAQETT